MLKRQGRSPQRLHPGRINEKGVVENVGLFYIWGKVTVTA